MTSKQLCASARGVADPREPQSALGDAADGDNASSLGERREELDAGGDLSIRRLSVRGRGPRMRRHDVPEEDVVLDPELVEHAVDDRRARLGRSRAGELSL